MQILVLKGSMLNSKLSFEFDYFNNKREKILIQKQGSTPQSSGIVPCCLLLTLEKWRIKDTSLR
jgi:hypothetical protein